MAGSVLAALCTKVLNTSEPHEKRSTNKQFLALVFKIPAMVHTSVHTCSQSGSLKVGLLQSAYHIQVSEWTDQRSSCIDITAVPPTTPPPRCSR